MTRSAELAAVIRPEVADRELERETQQVEEGMSEAVTGLTASIDTSEIQRQLENVLPGGRAAGTVADIIRGTGGAGGGPARGSADAIAGAGDNGVQLAQLEQLEEINDTLEKIGASGGGGGGLGVSDLLLGRTVGQTVTGGAGLLARGAGGLATLGLTSTLFAPEGAGNKFTGIEGKPTGPVFQALFGGGTKEQTLQNLRKETTGSTKPPLKDITIQKPEWLSTLSTATVAEPDWVSTLDNPDISKPDWLSTLDNPDISRPAWLYGLQNPDIDKPDWLSPLLNFSLPEPDWLSVLPGYDGSSKSGKSSGGGSSSSGSSAGGGGLQPEPVTIPEENPENNRGSVPDTRVPGSFEANQRPSNNRGPVPDTRVPGGFGGGSDSQDRLSDRQEVNVKSQVDVTVKDERSPAEEVKREVKDKVAEDVKKEVERAISGGGPNITR